MPYLWLILAAACGQTTQPATGRGDATATRPTIVAQAGQPTATRPVGIPLPGRSAPARAPRLTVGGAATQPVAAAAETAIRPLSPRVTVAKPTTQPVADAAPAPATQPATPPIITIPVPEPPVAAAPATQPSAAEVLAAATATQPAEQAEALRELARLSGAAVNIEVTPDGKLIITGTPEDIEILKGIVEELDRQLVPPFEVKVFKLEGAQAQDLAPKLEQFWQKAKLPPTGQLLPEDKITVIAEPRSNSLMVAASPQNIPQITDIIGQLDQPAAPVEIYPIPLKFIKAEEAATTISDLLKSRTAKIGTAAATPIDIKPDVRTNSLLVSASKTDYEQIKKLVEVLDVEPGERAPSRAIKMAIFPLEKAAAKDMVEVLKEMLQPGTAAGKAATEEIRRLQLILKARKEQKELPSLDLEKPIKLIPEPWINAVIVATVEANLDPIGEIIKLLDSVPMGDEILVKIYPLENADAETLATNLQKMFDQGKTLPEQPGMAGKVPGRIPPDLPGAALAYPIGLSSDKRTNALIVSGRPEQIVLVEQVVKAIDVPEDASKFPPRMIMLEHADARRVTEVLTKLADQRMKLAEKMGPNASAREQITVIPDQRSNAVIIIAKDDNFQELSKLAKDLDSISPEYLSQIHIINLQNLMAAELAGKIKDLFTGRAKLVGSEMLPTVVVDQRSNSLVIASNREDYEVIQRLVKELEQQRISPMADIRLVVVKHNDVTKLADTLRKMFDERMKISAVKGEESPPSERVAIVEDPFTRTMLVASSKTNYDEILRLMAQLDVPPSVDGLLRTFPIRNADVQRTADMLNELFKTGLYVGPRSAKDLPESMTKVTIIPDMRSSSLLVSASPENIAVIEQALKQIDSAELPPSIAEFRVFKLENVDAVSVADQLDNVFKGLQATTKEKETLQLQIVPNIRSNTLVVSGARLAIRRAEEIIPRLDVAPGTPTAQVRVYTLQQASAVRLGQELTTLFEKRSTDGKMTPVNIISDETSNSLIVTAALEDQALVQELLTRLDVKSTLAQQLEIVPLKQAKAVTLAEDLTKLLQQQQRGGQGGPTFAISADQRTNSLIVFAPPDLMANIHAIVGRLDTTKPTAEMALRVFELRNAKAEDLAKLLDDFFKAAGSAPGAGGAGSRDARQMIINFIPINTATGKPLINPDTGAELMERLVHQDITITPDKNTNSLLVMAPEGSIDMMQMLIEMLDSVKPVTAEIQTFPLLNADATEMKSLLDELFTTQGGGGEEGRRQLTIAGAEIAATVAPAAGVTGEIGAAPVEVTFAVDQRTNSLIAAGSPAYLKIVERLVTQLDYKEIEERMVRVVHLRNAKAEEVSTAMSAYFKEESSAIERVAKEEAAARVLQRQVTIQSGGETSNALLLSYSPRMESQIISMINELDQPPPQVMIQVLMAEVTLDDRFEMGMEFALQDLTFSENASLGRNNVVQGHGHDTIFGTDLGAAGTGGGISFTVTGEDFNFLFRALQTEGRLEVLSRPSVMVRDNQEANITVGERVPTVQDITVSAAGVVTPSVTYEEVGIILTVTPIINPDGFVNLDISPEISAIGTSSVTVASGVTLPTFTQRKAETSVTVKDGETIIIGGLITDRVNESENKVPIFGDIPFVGNAFRSTVRSTTKTELLIVLTPHVIRDAAQARAVSVEMRDKTGLIENIRTNPLMQGLQVHPEAGMGPCAEQPETQPAGALEEIGPELEEFGPQTGTIDVQPGMVAVRAESK